MIDMRSNKPLIVAVAVLVVVVVVGAVVWLAKTCIKCAR